MYFIWDKKQKDKNIWKMCDFIENKNYSAKRMKQQRYFI